MSIETDPVPPVPEHTPPLSEDAVSPPPGKFFNHAWTRWFTSVRAKINVINDSLVNLGELGVGPGILVKNGAAWLFRSIVGTPGRITVANGSGDSGNPTIDVEVGNLVAGSNVSFSGSGTGRLVGTGSLTINATGGGGGGGDDPTNPPWRSVVLQMPMSADFSDQSTLGWVPAAGGGAVISGGAGVFNGTTSNVRIHASAAVPFGLGYEDFCTDFYVTYNNFTGTPTVIDGGCFADFVSSGGFITVYGYASSTNVLTSPVAISTGVEYHIRYTRVNGYLGLFINGLLVNKATPASQNAVTTSLCRVGRNLGGAGFLNGRVRGLRYARGWGSLEDFTPPTLPLPTG